MAHVHDRMPVILRPDDYDLWLDPGFTKLEGLLELMKPYDARLMKKHPVSTRVGDPKNDDEQCAAKIELTMEQTQGSLFG
jgi:putative SOS response-associated peptidase YedK